MGPLLDATMWDLEIQGKTAVCVALDGSIRGVLGLADTAKPEAYSTIRALQGMHMDVWMVRSICFAVSSQYTVSRMLHSIQAAQVRSFARGGDACVGYS
jgi:high-affinity K+ transport system ATPase subunit B